MINEIDLTKFNRTVSELEEFLLFAIAVAGKGANATARGLDSLLRGLGWEPRTSPFEILRTAYQDCSISPVVIKNAGLGCYNQRFVSFHQAAHSGINLQTCSTDDLETIHGVGRKTSRFFLLHSRKNFRGAALDTHILKHLRDKGVENVPLATPGSSREYKRLEEAFIATVPKGKSIADFDLSVWRKYAGR